MEHWLLNIDLLRCQGVELRSFRTLSFCLVLNCGMGCMNVFACEGLGAFKTSVNRFLPALQLYLFHLSFSWDLRWHGGPLNL